MSRSFSSVGGRGVRLDAPEKVTGRAIYTDDIRRPDMLHGALLQSPLAHAKVLHVDTSRAERLPGVRAVITAANSPAVKFGVSPARYDETVFCLDRARYIGDEIAAVAAVDRETALEARQAHPGGLRGAPRGARRAPRARARMPAAPRRVRRKHLCAGGAAVRRHRRGPCPCAPRPDRQPVEQDAERRVSRAPVRARRVRPARAPDAVDLHPVAALRRTDGRHGPRPPRAPGSRRDAARRRRLRAQGIGLVHGTRHLPARPGDRPAGEDRVHERAGVPARAGAPPVLPHDDHRRRPRRDAPVPRSRGAARRRGVLELRHRDGLLRREPARRAVSAAMPQLQGRPGGDQQAGVRRAARSRRRDCPGVVRNADRSPGRATRHRSARDAAAQRDGAGRHDLQRPERVEPRRQGVPAGSACTVELGRPRVEPPAGPRRRRGVRLLRLRRRVPDLPFANAALHGRHQAG